MNVHKSPKPKLVLPFSSCFYPWSLDLKPWVFRWTFYPHTPCSSMDLQTDFLLLLQLLVSLRYRKLCGGAHGSFAVYVILFMFSSSFFTNPTFFGQCGVGGVGAGGCGWVWAVGFGGWVGGFLLNLPW